MITWDDRYKTGEESIDKQHQLLFEFFNNFEDGIQKSRGRSYVEQSFQFLNDYTKAHFGYEENCMNRFKCPFAAKNKNAHKEFSQALKVFQNKLQTDGYQDILLNEIHDFVEQWITNHIIGIDTHLKDAVKK